MQQSEATKEAVEPNNTNNSYQRRKRESSMIQSQPINDGTTFGKAISKKIEQPWDEEAPLTSSEPPIEKDAISTYSEHINRANHARMKQTSEQTFGADLWTIRRRQSQLTYSFEDTCDIGTRCWNSTPEIAGRSKDSSGPELVASLGDEGDATTSKVVKAEPHSFSQPRRRRRHFRRNHLRRNRS
ncbi:hypothetical protein Tco_0086883 [Tanacetum coccineum]